MITSVRLTCRYERAHVTPGDEVASCGESGAEKFYDGHDGDRIAQDGPLVLLRAPFAPVSGLRYHISFSLL
jgi:hypothetical protein